MNDEPVKKINRGFRLHRLIEVKTVGILLLKLGLPTFLLFKFFVIDFVSGIIALFIIYNFFYLFVSKSLTKVEENYKTIKRLFFDRFSKTTLTLNVKNSEKNDNVLLIDNEFVIGAKLIGKPIESLSSINQELELQKRLNFLVNNTFRYKVVSILEENENNIKEVENNSNINYLERKDRLTEYISQDYYVFYSRNSKKINEIIDLINSYKDLELIDSIQLSDVMSNLYDNFDNDKDNFKYYDIYFLHNIGKHLPRFYHYNAKKLVEFTGANFVYVADYIPYSIKDAENILNNDIRELRDTRVNKPKESEEASYDDLKDNMRVLAAALNRQEERIYKYSAYFLIEKGLSENKVKELLKEISTSCGLYFSNINIISKYIFKDRFKINPIKTFDIQSNVLKKDFVNERCLLNDMYGKYLSKANNGHIIFNPFVEGRNRKSFSMQILGVTGMGKSTLLKLLIHNNFYSNNKTIILDVQAEYKLLTEHLGGEVIDSNNVFINIMEIFINEYLLEGIARANTEILWQKNLEDNVERIISFFTHFIQDSSLLTELRTSLYEYYNVLYMHNNKDMYCTRNYTLKDFYEFVKLQNKNINKNDNYVNNIKAERKALLELEIESLVISNSNYFTQKTKLDLNNNLICLDLHQLMDNEDDSILKKAFIRQLYSVVILREMKMNRKLNESNGIGRHNFTKNFDKTRFLAIIIDEEHEILNSDDESFITRLNSYTRLAPKCFTGIWGASHTIDDYNLAAKDSASLKRKTLIDLRTYKLIMKQPKSCEDTYDKYIITNDVESNLTIDHIRNTFKYDSGQFLLSFGSEVYEGYIEVNKDLKPLVYRVVKD